jgi:hypothetical protein
MQSKNEELVRLHRLTAKTMLYGSALLILMLTGFEISPMFSVTMALLLGLVSGTVLDRWIVYKKQERKRIAR